MKFNSDVIAWLVENWKRWSTKSPTFFRVWQTIGSVCALVTGIPLALQQADMFLGFHIPLPDLVNHWMMRVVFACGLVVKLMTKLPTVQSAEQSPETHPYTINQINKSK